MLPPNNWWVGSGFFFKKRDVLKNPKMQVGKLKLSAQKRFINKKLKKQRQKNTTKITSVIITEQTKNYSLTASCPPLSQWTEEVAFSLFSSPQLPGSYHLLRWGVSKEWYIHTNKSLDQSNSFFEWRAACIHTLCFRFGLWFWFDTFLCIPLILSFTVII